MKFLKVLAVILVAVMAPVIGVQKICQFTAAEARGVADWLALGKGIVMILACPLAVIGLVIHFALWRDSRRKAAQRRTHPDKARNSVDLYSCDNVKDWVQTCERARAKSEAERAQWTPEHPKPQTVDWDDGTCPYKRDSSQPLGSKANPVVAGHPYASTHLVFSSERGCWILTDGLGNGLIR